MKRPPTSATRPPVARRRLLTAAVVSLLGARLAVAAPSREERPRRGLECRVSHVVRVPPARTVYLADVVATTIHEGVCDEDGRLRVSAAPFFGMTAGSGEFFTLGEKVGHIGQTAGRSDIWY